MEPAKVVVTGQIRFTFIASGYFLLQPKQIHEIKDFLLTARRKDAKCK